MQELINHSEKMSSRRIAEKTGKVHSNVLRDIRSMLQDLQESQDSNLNPTEYEIIEAKNGMTAEIKLNERLSLCLAAGYSTVLRMAIIDDWASMKSKTLPVTALPTVKELALMVVKAEEEKERLQAENYKLASKSEYVDKVLSSVSEITTTTIAKELGMTARTLNKCLHGEGIQYFSDGHYVLYAKYQNKGLAETRTYQYFDRQGVSHTKHYLVWTERGRVMIHNLFNENLSWSQPSKRKALQK